MDYDELAKTFSNILKMPVDVEKTREIVAAIKVLKSAEALTEIDSGSEEWSAIATLPVTTQIVDKAAFCDCTKVLFWDGVREHIMAIAQLKERGWK